MADEPSDADVVIIGRHSFRIVKPLTSAGKAWLDNGYMSPNYPRWPDGSITLSVEDIRELKRSFLFEGLVVDERNL